MSKILPLNLKYNGDSNLKWHFKTLLIMFDIKLHVTNIVQPPGFQTDIFINREKRGNKLQKALNGISS